MPIGGRGVCRSAWELVPRWASVVQSRLTGTPMARLLRALSPDRRHANETEGEEERGGGFGDGCV